MLHLVAGPVLPAAHAAEVVVGQHARPHEVRPGVVVVGGCQGLGRGGENGFHEALAQTVRHVHVLRGGEVALHDVGEHVRGAAGGLVSGEGTGVPGVHDGENGAVDVAFDIAPLQIFSLQGNDAGVGGLAAGGGQGQHHAHGQGLLRRLFGEEVPEIAVVGHAHADGLGGVDGAAAAHRQNEVHALPAAQVDALVHLAAAGVGLDTAQLHPGDAGLPQGSSRIVICAVALDAAAAVDHQHLCAAETAH